MSVLGKGTWGFGKANGKLAGGTSRSVIVILIDLAASSGRTLGVCRATTREGREVYVWIFGYTI